MTTLELRDIETRLAVWRAERHLTTEGQREGLLSNILEELTEYTRAQNNEERIDAICDITVFAINAHKTPIMLDKSIKKIISETKEPLNSETFCRAIFDNLYSGSIISICAIQCELLGYDYYKCMMETIKEISSRVGHFDETINKFVKDKSPEAQAKWYKANYSICKKEAK